MDFQFSDCSFEEEEDEEKEEWFDFSIVNNKSDQVRIIPINVTPSNAPPTDVISEDGWISDNDQCTDGSDERVNNEYLIEYIKGVWFDNGKNCTSQKLKDVIYSVFDDHCDTYSLIIATVSRIGKSRPQPNSITRIILNEFINWRSLRQNVPKCTANHQSQIISLLEKCHHVVFDLLADIFDLSSADRHELIELIKQLINIHSHSNALSYIIKLNLQEEFDVKIMLIPFVAMDKINLIENYLSPFPKLQNEFLKYIEELYTSGDALDRVKCELRREGIQFTKTDKMTRPQLEKLSIRLINLFNLSKSDYPHLFERKAILSLNYLLHKKYIEKALNDNEVLEAAVRDRPALQYHLITELVCYNDLSLASHYTSLFKLPSDHLPVTLRDYITACNELKTCSSRNEYIVGGLADRNTFESSIQSIIEEDYNQDYYYSLKLPVNNIIFVNSKETFILCRQQLEKVGNIIGIDAEWQFAICNDGEERLSLLQLAISSAVFLIDTINLPKLLPHSLIKEFVNAIFGSKNTLKLGYQVQGDISMLAKTWPFAASSLINPKRVIDLKYMSQLIFEPTLPRITVTVIPGYPKQYINNYGRGWHRLPPPPSLSPSGLASTTATGLSLLVMKCFGKPLDKRQQLSNWNRRPLLDQQVKYAALDAYCLLEVYDYLMLSTDDRIPKEPTLDYMKERMKCEKQERKKIKKTISSISH